MDAQLDDLKWDSNGLIAAIIQDEKSSRVLALFWMNKEALAKTIETKKVHSYSRSRKRLALKGESSGHIEHVKAIHADCDKDALVITVDQVGGACHEGYFSCFFRKFDPASGQWIVSEQRVFDPQSVYEKK